MPGLPGECIRRDDEHRALSVSQAIPARPTRAQPHQHAMTASAQDQQVTRTAGHADQHPARRAPLDLRLHHRIAGDFPPHRDERLPKTLPGHVTPDLTQIALGRMWDTAITPRRQPRDNGDQQRIVGAGLNLRIAQCPQAAR